MPRLVVIGADGATKAFDVADGTTVMQAAIAHGIAGIVGECGGNCMCATCHVYADPDWIGALPPISADEDALLDGTAADRLPGSRLGCQIRLGPALDGLTLRLPDRQV